MYNSLWIWKGFFQGNSCRKGDEPFPECRIVVTVSEQVYRGGFGTRQATSDQIPENNNGQGDIYWNGGYRQAGREMEKQTTEWRRMWHYVLVLVIRRIINLPREAGWACGSYPREDCSVPVPWGCGRQICSEWQLVSGIFTMRIFSGETLQTAWGSPCIQQIMHPSFLASSFHCSFLLSWEVQDLIWSMRPRLVA